MTKRQRAKDRQRTQRVPVQLPDLAGASGNWLRSIRLSGFAIAALSLIVLFVVVLAPSLRILVEQQQQIASLRADVQQQKDAVKGMKGELARWNDPSYVESLARERLNYVYPGEYSYLVIDDGKTLATADGQPISAKLQTTQVDWVRTMLSSVLTAGLTNAPASKLVAPVISGQGAQHQQQSTR
ncbi:FtsB family cell division protein [Parafrigoribacterium soli]|uniref:FtsB family cell division protein n=1 Tax=Parafrigoribacterium soli TaxID=3144663 RepID=UPI0032EBF8FF